jgi:hypothetical protein
MKVFVQDLPGRWLTDKFTSFTYVLDKEVSDKQAKTILVSSSTAVALKSIDRIKTYPDSFQKHTCGTYLGLYHSAINAFEPREVFIDTGLIDDDTFDSLSFELEV